MARHGALSSHDRAKITQKTVVCYAEMERDYLVRDTWQANIADEHEHWLLDLLVNGIRRALCAYEIPI
jgi:hypothetical protein